MTFPEIASACHRRQNKDNVGKLKRSRHQSKMTFLVYTSPHIKNDNIVNKLRMRILRCPMPHQFRPNNFTSQPTSYIVRTNEPTGNFL